MRNPWLYNVGHIELMKIFYKQSTEYGIFHPLSPLCQYSVLIWRTIKQNYMNLKLPSAPRYPLTCMDIHYTPLPQSSNILGTECERQRIWINPSVPSLYGIISSHWVSAKLWQTFTINNITQSWQGGHGSQVSRKVLGFHRLYNK